ncbi:siroheme decarboxylase subunit beta [Sedimentitalea nanhaiensis]|uniref:siroheme decarboxylase n=1 Tax=Sedimentitalea nanhaiensis TaxID=999627 RepID=A0A1I6XK61_9RHOB|nr:AsnC family transcriptional regulator [Sedimentitalea nanhaiensis]SFT38690.1 transcriptional regulator, AsnC family [Sedimentitalea nanhaiensis]
MEGVNDPLDQALLDDWQRNFPITPQPFAELACSLGLSENEVIARLQRQVDNARVTRVGATCAPNIISASTLAAVAAPESRIEEVAAVIGAQPGVNHSYLRENDWNLWFVATGPDRAHVDATLAQIAAQTGLRVLDLRLVRAFNVDLGFALRGKTTVWKPGRTVDAAAFQPGDRAILQMLMKGLPLVPRPYRVVAQSLDLDEQSVLDRVRVLTGAGIIARLGIIVRHRALGWRSNAMVVWDMTHAQITRAGPILAAQPGITLCYERTPVPGVWPYRLYSMIHSRSRVDAMATLTQVCTLPEFAEVPHLPLFSLHCFKQTGAMVAAPEKEIA